MAIAQPIVVCQSLPSGERQPAVLATFDALKPFENLVLESDHPQSPVLALLQAERPGLFEWSPLEEGPPRWRTEIIRRVGSRSLRELTETLSWDHDRLDELQREAFSRRETGDLAAALEVFRTFSRGLKRHIGFEDELVFPEFERRSGMGSDEGPTAVLRAEHREIEVLLDEIERTLPDPLAPVAGLRSELERVLSHHNLKEEQVLYPGTDRLMSAEERDDLVRRVQSFAAGRG